MALETPKVDIGWQAPDFSLLGTDNNWYSLSKVRGPKGIVIAFICNHCPYVQSIANTLAKEAEALAEIGIGLIGINSNDDNAYPEDSFQMMQLFAQKNHFSFPYVIDTTQEVARNYEAVCTPDFFGFDKNLKLQYRGRLNATRKETIPNAKRELFLAMKEIAEKGIYSDEQFPSIGCSIKWRENKL